jgi:hypothetical protein
MVNSSEDDRVASKLPRERKSRARVWGNRVIAVAIVLGVIVIPLLTFTVGPAWLGRYDESHRIKVTCKVDSADANIASSRSAKGAGGSQPQVTFHTDCGNLIYADGVDRSNMKRIAESVESNALYRFEVGAGTFNLRMGLKVVKVAPTVYGYSQVRK